MGWKTIYNIDRSVMQAIITVVPHTSNWDFFMGRICFTALDIRVRFLIKKEVFIFPFSLILRMWGGLPVDRKNPGNLQKMLAAKFNKYEEFMLAITPEGTRKPNPKWKKGFYRIAQEAKVPLVLTYLDYKKKDAMVGKVFHPTGNYAADMKVMDDYFSMVNPKHLEGYVRPKY
ncbi:MAG: 1-acyl-sn-glycerol-3-phosphate acyltransferase [Bacteroidales bacterium]|nr:1-acyl-sn-glycerol-3-phosphate acyltransferase [Bacteroidales bacterium]